MPSSPLPMFDRVELQECRMHEMMARLNVDPVALARTRGGDAYAEARSRCLFCRSSDECRRWLDQPVCAGERPPFCPCLPLFEVCNPSLSKAASSGLTHRPR